MKMLTGRAAVGLLVMMYPILCKVRYESLHNILSSRGIWKQILFSVFVNWIVAPFLMVCNQMPLQTSLTWQSSVWRGPFFLINPNFVSASFSSASRGASQW